MLITSLEKFTMVVGPGWSFYSWAVVVVCGCWVVVCGCWLLFLGAGLLIVGSGACLCGQVVCGCWFVICGCSGDVLSAVWSSLARLEGTMIHIAQGWPWKCETRETRIKCLRKNPKHLTLTHTHYTHTTTIWVQEFGAFDIEKYHLCL